MTLTKKFLLLTVISAMPVAAWAEFHQTVVGPIKTENTLVHKGCHDFKVIEIEPAGSVELRWVGNKTVGGFGAFVPLAGGEYDAPSSFDPRVLGDTCKLMAKPWGKEPNTKFVVEVDD